jgi:hypothetical protein
MSFLETLTGLRRTQELEPRKEFAKLLRRAATSELKTEELARLDGLHRTLGIGESLEVLVEGLRHIAELERLAAVLPELQRSYVEAAQATAQSDIEFYDLLTMGKATLAAKSVASLIGADKAHEERLKCDAVEAEGRAEHMRLSSVQAVAEADMKNAMRAREELPKLRAKWSKDIVASD